MNNKETGRRAVMLDAAIDKAKEEERERRRAERSRKYSPNRRRR